VTVGCEQVVLLQRNFSLIGNLIEKTIVMFMGVIAMRSAVRKTRSFSLDPEVLDQIENTKGQSSASEREIAFSCFPP